jgi:hypothetical protein
MGFGEASAMAGSDRWLAAIAGMIGIGALFQSSPEPPQSVAVVPL